MSLAQLPQAPTLLTVDAAAAALRVIPPATIRDWIYHAEARVGARGDELPPNGFAECVVRVPGHGRVLVDYERMLQWIEAGRGKPARKRRGRLG